MKKTILTIAIVLGLLATSIAQERNGIFNRGGDQNQSGYSYRTNDDPEFGLPSSHGATDDAAAPLGGGALLLIGFGAAYALKKRNEK